MSGTSNDACDPALGQYGYIPALVPGIVFCTLFSIATIYSTFYTARRRLWFISIALGGTLELLGWAARAAAHNDACSSGLFTMQICLLILGPAFFSAALYIILGIFIREAPHLSLLSPKMYLIVFCSLDFLSLLLQAVGGALASTADTKNQLDIGTWIIVGGILLQLLGMAIFSVLGAMFLFLAHKNRVRFHPQVLAISIFATTIIFLRNIYRAVELIQGWNGYIDTHEKFIVGLDGVPMTLCIFGLCYLIFLDSRTEGLLAREDKTSANAFGAEDTLTEQKSEPTDSTAPSTPTEV